MKKIVTIGVYGFDKEGFFQALLDAQVDTFCDIRLRRGMRGSEYAFVNSASLQKRLAELGIRYFHVKGLAPTKAIREKQYQEDARLGVAKRRREILSQVFVSDYEQECLAHFSSDEFRALIGPEAEIICLFCVEGEPEACHRSLAARQLAGDLELPVEHVRPPIV